MRWRAQQLSVARSTGLVSHFLRLPSAQALGYYRSSASRTELVFFLLLIGTLLTISPKIFAQEKETDEVVKVNTDLVVFDAQVIDKDTKWVIGDLNKDDFEVFENGVKQPISYFSRDSLPLSIMLLLDVSGSVRPILHQIRDGALNALQRLKPDDQVAVMAFATTRELVQGFTKDRALDTCIGLFEWHKCNCPLLVCILLQAPLMHSKAYQHFRARAVLVACFLADSLTFLRRKTQHE